MSEVGKIAWMVALCWTLLWSSTSIVPDTCESIQEALDNAKPGDTILVKPGIYKEHLLWPKTNGIKLIGSGGAAQTILDAADGDTGSLCGIHTGVDSSTYIRGFSFKNARVGGT